MKYSLGIWQVDSQENKLRNTQTSEEIRMSPRAMEVLHYFLQNPSKVISLEELIEKIWLGRIVGDHAVYRVINKIRKHLDSDNKDAYIETIPRMGYKLIQAVDILEGIDSAKRIDKIEVAEIKLESTPKNNTQKKQVSKQTIFLLLVVLLFAIGAGFFTKPKNTTPQVQSKNVQIYNSFLPFISLHGFHDYVSSSANGRYIIFSYKKTLEAGFDLYLQDLDTNKIEQITQSTQSDIKAKVSNDAQTIVFVREGLRGCEVIHLKNYQDTYLEENLFNCIDNENIDISLNHAGSKIFYTHKNSLNFKNSIYSMVVNTGERMQLTSTALGVLSGQSEIVLSRDENILYFLTTDNSHKSIVFSFDLTNRKEELVMQKEEIIENLNIRASNNSLTYNASNTSVIELSLDDLSETEIITSLSERIYSYAFIGNTDSVLMVTGNEENSIWQKSLSRSVGLEQLTVSAYQDIYPSYSNSSEYISFVSNRGGQPQLWLKSSDSSLPNDFELRDFKDRALTDWFKWSPDDSKILTFNGDSIYLIDTKSGELTDLVNTKDYPDAKYPSWSYDGSLVYFSSSKTGEIQLYEFNLDSKIITQYSDTGVVTLFDQGENGRYFFKAYRQGLWKDNQGIEKLIIPNISASKFVHSVDFTSEGMYFLKDLSYQLYYYRFLDLDDSLAQHGRVIIEPKKMNTILPNKYFSINSNNEKLIFYQTKRDKTRLLKNR